MRLNAKFLLSELRALVPVTVELSKINRSGVSWAHGNCVPPSPELSSQYNVALYSRRYNVTLYSCKHLYRVGLY